jgi:plasmid stabilization system protein ParE
MPRGDKSSYTAKQKRQAEHIEEGYEHRGVPEREAERRAWAAVNKETGAGKKSGSSGRGKRTSHVSSRKGGRLGGAAAAKRPANARSASAKNAAATRKRKATSK